MDYFNLESSDEFSDEDMNFAANEMRYLISLQDDYVSTTGNFNYLLYIYIYFV